MKRLFIVCGPESAGNRLVAAYLARAGVDIDASTAHQAQDRSRTSNADNVGLIKHHNPNLTLSIETGFAAGRAVSMVVTGREHGALVRSMIERGHVDSEPHAERRIRMAYVAAFGAIDRYDLPFVMTSYESLVLHPRETVSRLLSALNLPNTDLDRPIEVQGTRCAPDAEDRNLARYA